MAGYQGRFRTPEDGSGSRWVHWGKRGRFDPQHVSIDLWPDVAEYPKTYETPFKLADGTQARVFSSRDASTVDTHFRWWYNLKSGGSELNEIPRQGGRFFWEMIHGSVEAGAEMLYVAMFDEVDEGTAIFKLCPDPPVGSPPARFVDPGDVPGDHYLWLAGQGGRLLRGEIPANPALYRRTDPETRDHDIAQDRAR